MVSTYLKAIDFFVPVLEPRPGYIRGVLRDGFVCAAVGFVLVGYIDKEIDADLGLYNWAQGNTAKSSVVEPISRSFHDSILCSFNRLKRDAFLFDAEEDVHIDHPASQVQGSVVFEAFSNKVIEGEGDEQPSSQVKGHCTFYIDNNEQRTHYIADAFPENIAGTRRQLLDPALVK